MQKSTMTVTHLHRRISRISIAICFLVQGIHTRMPGIKSNILNESKMQDSIETLE